MLFRSMGREERGGSGWGTRVHPWWIHVDIWQNQYNIVKLKNEKKYCFTHIYDGVINKMLFILMYSIKNQWEMNRKKRVQ